MIQRSQDWEWSSLKPTARSGPDGLLCDGPILKPAQWTHHVNAVETEAELKALRHSLARGTPLGDTHWQTKPLRSSALNPRFDRPFHPARNTLTQLITNSKPAKSAPPGAGKNIHL
jgi:hypothetical protein